MPHSGPAAREDFSSLLDARARAAAGSEASAAPKRRAGPVYAVGTSPESGSQSSDPLGTTEALSRIYAGDSAPTAAPPPAACDSETIAHELQLAPELTARDLERIRREFALANHPDRVAPLDRDLATRRMTLANMLIDKALQEKRGTRGRG
jgi:hypothetical protein